MTVIPNLRRLAYSICGLLTLMACQKKDATTGPDRPLEPWAFRSVLDSTPRVLTLALHDQLWAAYHTDSCSLFKVWKGNVRFQGAVYDQAHGPQPESLGDGWLHNPYKQPWQVRRGDQSLLREVRYSGHSLKNGRATLHYALLLEDGHVISASESPEAIEQDGQMSFERLFTLANVPEGVEVSLAQQVTSVALTSAVTTDGTWTVTEETRSDIGGKQSLTLDGQLQLLPNAETRFSLAFISTPAIPNPRSAGQPDELLPLGERLIAKSDCRTCHNERATTIGPSYLQIAARYPNTEASVLTLSRKIITGGTGVWGMQVMSAHPELPESDAQEMVRYILRLDTADAGQEGAGAMARQLDASRSDGDGLLPGLLTEAWTDLPDYNQIPGRQVLGQPDQAGIVTQFQGIDPTDFGGLTEDFVLRAEGFLYIDKETSAGIRVLSDDGSRVTLDGQVVLDNDGLHGTEVKETNLLLTRGYHTLLLEYHQGKGGRYLSLEWKPDTSVTWTGIPAERLFHPAAEHGRLLGKSLSMTIGTQIPGDKAPVTRVHPAYDLTQARPDDFTPKVGGIDFMSDGSMIVSVWDPTGAVYRITGHQGGDPAAIRVQQIASGLAEPLGLKVIRDTIYVLQKQELTRLIDTDRDGLIDEYQCVNNRWPTTANFHEFAFGLAEKDGDLFATLAIAIQPGGASGTNQVGSRGKCVRFDLPSGEMSYIASGFRTPNGIGIGVDGELFVADNQGDWLPSSKILHVTQGDFFGSRAVDPEGTKDLREKPPVVWLPQDEIGNSPSTPLALPDGPYKGQMIHGEVTHGGVKRVFVEKINGEYQGAVFRFIQGLEAGINRMAWGPDGSLYVGGIGNPGNWGQTDKHWYGLQRLTYNGRPVFEMLAVRAMSDGVEIEFTEPLREGDGWDPADWEIRQWRYVPTIEYGGPKVDDRPLRILATTVSEDRRKVSLKLDGMRAGHVVYVHLLDRFISESGLEMWSTEAWYTLNQIPADRPVQVRPAPNFPPNTLTASEREAGWELLFDGVSTEGWHSYGKPKAGSSWIVRDGVLMLDARQDAEGNWRAPDGGDLVSAREYENFELLLDWRISPCGNSGIIFNVTESPEYSAPWQTGPEMQILDNACHPDARHTTHRAGDLYDMIACDPVTVKPAGEWNQVRLVKQDGKVSHWMNGCQVVAYEMYTPEWEARVAKSKFKDMAGFGKARSGHIVLQDHDNIVSFRNIRIRPL